MKRWLAKFCLWYLSKKSSFPDVDFENPQQIDIVAAAMARQLSAHLKKRGLPTGQEYSITLRTYFPKVND